MPLALSMYAVVVLVPRNAPITAASAVHRERAPRARQIAVRIEHAGLVRERDERPGRVEEVDEEEREHDRGDAQAGRRAQVEGADQSGRR